MSFEGTGAEILVEALRRAEVKFIFGVPGDTGVALYDALARQQEVRHVLARDERSAASMADAYARVTRQVGVVEASSGGGATFLVGGLGEPYAASVPMLVITSDIHRSSRGSSAITEIDQQKLFSAVTKAQLLVESARDIADQLHQALSLAVSGRPGPVSLIIPEDVFEERASISGALSRARIRVTTPPDDAALNRAVALLDRASRPALVAGSGVHLSGAWQELLDLAEKLNAPVATTIHGKGAFPESHPLSLGVVGANGAHDYANEYLHQADVVVFVGTRANSTDTDGFRSPDRTKVQAIHIDMDPDRAGKNYTNGIPLIGDAAALLADLYGRVKPDERRGQSIRTWIAARQAAFCEQRAEPPLRGLDPRRVVELVQHRTGARAIVVGDAGTPTPYLSSYWVSAGFGRDVVLPRGHGAMGFAIPAALGMALGKPERLVVSFTTDGSFGMACGELETLARLGLPIIVVHFSNGSLGWIKSLQHFFMERRYFGVDFGAVDAVGVARGFGLEGERVSSMDELDQALTAAMRADGPYFIDVPVPEEFELLPPVAPWQAALLGQGGRPVY